MHDGVVLVGSVLILVSAAWALDPLGRPEGEDRLKPRGRTVRLEPVLTSAAEALPTALAALRLKPDDITFDPEDAPRDAHRRTLVDRLMKDPHQLEPEVLGISKRLISARARAGELLAEAFRLSDLAVPAAKAQPAVSIAAALERFCDRRLDPADVTTHVALARLESLPPRLRAALAALLGAHADARAAMAGEAAKLDAAAFAVVMRSCMAGERIPGEREEARLAKLLVAAARLDRARPAVALHALSLASAEVVAAIGALSDGQRDAVTSTRVPGKHGAFFLGGTRNDLTGERDLLVVDLGGHDRHDLTVARAPRRGFGDVRVIVDAGGRDFYLSRELPLAGGFCGVGLIWDVWGDDVYDAHACSLGAGVLGAGLLIDEHGDDSYRVMDTGQGYAMFGIGMLVDLEGTDSYHARGLSQGAGYTGGVALLVDHRGHDSYYVNGGEKDFRGDFFDSNGQGYAVGFREQASGGIGGVVDGAGNDTYSGDYWAQGVGYWYGLGFLMDRSGNDRYTAGRYAQGAGVHAALGALLDGGGNDTYVATAVSQGCGYDEAVGLLHDWSGNDVYVAHDFAQGRGFANGYGLLREDSGSDAYMAWQTDAQGYGAPSAGFGSVGVLLDLGGLDRYAPEGRNNTILTRGDLGVLLDAPLNGASR